mmetsp:Transcript_44990/g.66782  ORF Transcript_44990/g.66782 Transcript_44990/m.66782 type:complete len:245 (+) Transcript_44990:1302-2036(+)
MEELQEGLRDEDGEPEEVAGNSPFPEVRGGTQEAEARTQAAVVVAARDDRILAVEVPHDHPSTLAAAAVVVPNIAQLPEEQKEVEADGSLRDEEGEKPGAVPSDHDQDHQTLCSHFEAEVVLDKVKKLVVAHTHHHRLLRRNEGAAEGEPEPRLVVPLLHYGCPVSHNQNYHREMEGEVLRARIRCILSSLILRPTSMFVNKMFRRKQVRSLSQLCFFSVKSTINNAKRSIIKHRYCSSNHSKL